MVWRLLRQFICRRHCALLALVVAYCPLGSAETASVAAVSGQVVPGDHYPPRHIDFAGGVVGYPDLVYETLPGFRPLHLDLYRPAGGAGKNALPFVVYLHGGGWMNGHTRQSGAFTSWPDVLASLAGRGYVVASVEYRLSGEARFPAAEQDVKAAIRWLRSQAATYHIDKTRGLVWGASAGGQLAGLTATSCGVTALEPVGPPAYTGEPPVPPPGAAGAPLPDESDCVQGGVTWYGIFDFSTFPDRSDSADAKYLGCQISKCAPGVVAAASPVTYIDRNDPPMLLIHGLADKTVPVQQSQEMYDKLHAAGVPVQLFLVPDVDHSFIGKTPADTQKASRAALARVFDFIDKTIGARGTK
jgi:acetyl esterase/lipase